MDGGGGDCRSVKDRTWEVEDEEGRERERKREQYDATLSSLSFHSVGIDCPFP